MKLLLTIDRICSCWAIIYDAAGARICALDSDNAAEDATAIVTAVNERAADKAEIERLRKALWRIIIIVGFNPDGPRRGRDCAEIAYAALDAEEVTG